MKLRKVLCSLITVVMMVACFSFAVSAEDGEGTTYTMQDGFTFSVPPEYEGAFWVGMDANDPAFAEEEMTYEDILRTYEYCGVEFQTYAVFFDDDRWIRIVELEADSPYDGSEESFLDDPWSVWGSFSPIGNADSVETLGSGLVNSGDIPVYKLAFAISGQFPKAGYLYTLITDSGRLHQLVAFLECEGEGPYTDEQYGFLDYTAEFIEGTFRYDGETTPIEGNAFSGMNFSGEVINGAADAGSVFDEGATTYTTLSGLTMTLPSDFSILWDGMSEDDPFFSQVNVGYDDIIAQYEEFGVELQGGYTPEEDQNGQFYNILLVELDAPETPDEAAILSYFCSNVAEWDSQDPSEFDLEANADGLYGYGTIETGCNTLFHVAYQLQGDAHFSVRDYYLFTDAGKMYVLEVILINYVDSNESFTEEALAYLDNLGRAVAGSLSYEGGTISPEAEPFRMIIGDAAVEIVGSTDASESSEASDASPAPANAKAPSKNFFKSFTEFEFPVWIIAGAMLLMLLAGAKVNKKLDWQEEPFALDTSKCIQGFAAVAIIIHHLTQNLEERSGLLWFMSECGVLFVGIFFFFSGYGLYTSLKTKKDYLKTFLKKRFVTILVPFYMCIFVFVAAACIGGEKFKGKEIFDALSGWILVNTHMWYIVEIAILYLVFFILYRLIKNRTVATVLMTAFVLGMMWFSLRLAHGEDYSCRYWFQGEWWYNSSLLFVVGIVVSKHSESLGKIARKAYWGLIPVFGFLVWFLGAKTHNALMTYSYWSEEPGGDPAVMDKLRCLSVQLPWILCFVMLVLLIMMKVRFGNPVLKFLGAISLELYLSHNLFLTGLQDGSIFRVKSASMYMILTILMAIGFATVISGVDKYIIGLITGRRKDDLKLAAVDRIHSIDVMRIVMAFLVVTIHWPFEGKAGQVFITFGKTAVPFFLVVCGYLLFREDSKEMMKRLIKQTKRIAIFYVLANIFYAGALAWFVRQTTGSLVQFKECFKTKPLMDFLLYNFSPFSEHLWYLGSLLYALLIMLVLNKLKVLKHAVFAGPVLIAAYVILSHLGVGEGYQLRNAVLVGMAYTLTGMLIRRFEKKILSMRFLVPVLLVLSVICSAGALFELNHYKQGTEVPFVGCEILTIVIVLLCLRFPNFGVGTFAEKLGRDCSLPIYIMHIAVLFLFLGTHNEKFFGDYGAVAIFVVTAAVTGAYVSIKHAIAATGTAKESESAKQAEVASEKI